MVSQIELEALSGCGTTIYAHKLVPLNHFSTLSLSILIIHTLETSKSYTWI